MDDIVVRFSANYPPSMLKPGLPSGMRPPSLVRSALVRDQIEGALIRIRASAAAAAPRFAPLSIKLIAGQNAQALIPFSSASGVHPALYTFNSATGAWTNPATAGVPAASPYVGSLHWHQILKRLHRGDIIGVNGRWVLVTADLCLLFLATSGIVMYFQMLARRRRVGAKGWFW